MKTGNPSLIVIIFLVIGMILPHAFSESVQPPTNPNEIKSLPYSGTQFNLKINETFSPEATAFKIQLFNVTSDSRCPDTAYCIWQGQVTVSVGVTLGSQHLGNFSLSTLSGHDQIVFGNYDLLITQVNPSASIGKKISPSDYVITFVISNVSAESPLKQFKSGIPVGKIKCSAGLQIVIKTEDGSPACVQPDTARKLVQRGWANETIPITTVPPQIGTNDTSNENNGTLVTLVEGQREGPLLVQKILQDSVQGLDFREYPLATNIGYPITLNIGDAASNGCTVELTLVKIGNNTATFLKKEYQNRPCPICLSENTVIDTPNGPVNVKNLKVGMNVFTQDSSGHKISVIILKTGRAPVSQDQKILHVIFDDKRELFVSENHPTADGRFFGELSAGDALDGSKIKNIYVVPYNGTYTYDILPSGDTGFYWANGILVGSTLMK